MQKCRDKKRHHLSFWTSGAFITLLLELLLGRHCQLDEISGINQILHQLDNSLGGCIVDSLLVFAVIHIAKLGIILQYIQPIRVTDSILRYILLDVLDNHVEFISRYTLANELLHTLNCKI